jgi:hypothetical protein
LQGVRPKQTAAFFFKEPDQSKKICKEPKRRRKGKKGKRRRKEEKEREKGRKGKKRDPPPTSLVV